MSKSIYCPYCHVHTQLTVLWSYGNRHGEYHVGSCSACYKLVLWNDATNEIFPLPLPSPVDNRIPSYIKSDFEEAKKCFSILAYRASAVMARRAIQTICLDKGAKEGDKLNDQIDWLLTQGIITKELQEWAHEVRLLGNDGAHPKKPGSDQLVTKEDAEDILQLLNQFCEVLYVAPSISQERKKLRTQPKN